MCNTIPQKSARTPSQICFRPYIYTLFITLTTREQVQILELSRYNTSGYFDYLSIKPISNLWFPMTLH